MIKVDLVLLFYLDSLSINACVGIEFKSMTIRSHSSGLILIERKKKDDSIVFDIDLDNYSSDHLSLLSSIKLF